MNTNIYGDFQICISVPLREVDAVLHEIDGLTLGAGVRRTV